MPLSVARILQAHFAKPFMPVILSVNSPAAEYFLEDLADVSVAGFHGRFQNFSLSHAHTQIVFHSCCFYFHVVF